MFELRQKMHNDICLIGKVSKWLAPSILQIIVDANQLFVSAARL
jgi:hypothetical protein